MHSIIGPYQNYSRLTKPRIIDISPEEDSPTEPLTLIQVKAWLKIDFEDEDTLITELITACREAMEQFCAISIVEKTITMTADWGNEWELPYGPVKSITSINRRNSNTYEAITVDTDYLLDGTLFKTLKVNNCGRIQVVYVAGYETEPKDLLLDLKRIIAYCYEHRGDEALTSLQGGMERPKSMDEALELFASKHRRMLWL